MAKAKIPVLQKTYAQLVEKKVLLESIISLEQKEKALENGNRLENIQNSDSEFHPSLTVNEVRLREIKQLISIAQVTKPERQNQVVKIGSIVTLKYPKQTITMSFDGMSFEKGTVSLQSPLGSKIFGKKAGDFISLNDMEIKIEEIQFPK